jgi:transposase
MSKRVSGGERPDRDSSSRENGQKRRRFTKEFKEEAVQMLLDGHTESSVAQRLGLIGPQLLYRWKKDLIGQAGATASTLETRVRELERELRRVERERDILKKALAIFGRDE